MIPRPTSETEIDDSPMLLCIVVSCTAFGSLITLSESGISKSHGRFSLCHWPEALEHNPVIFLKHPPGDTDCTVYYTM